jgi:hypothetical protein
MPAPAWFGRVQGVSWVFFPPAVRRRYGVALPMLVGWTHPYAPFGAPLVDSGMCEAVLDAWLDHIARHPQFPKLMLLPYFPVDRPLAAALDCALERRGGRAASFGRQARALLAPGEARGGYLARAIEGKKRKELRRQRKRIGDLGSVTVMDARTPGEVGCALDDFFALERGGWKGRAGTAARCDGAIASFMQAAVPALATEGKAQVLRLCMDDQPISALVMLRSGGNAWCWKIAYDEAHGRFSPGVQLLLEATERLLCDPSVAGTDSCATPDHPMIDHVWRERLVVADRLMRVDREESLRFDLACGLESLRHRVVMIAKSLRRLANRSLQRRTRLTNEPAKVPGCPHEGCRPHDWARTWAIIAPQ